MKLIYWTIALWILAGSVPAAAQDSTATQQSASPAEKAELEGRWTEAVKLRKDAFAAQATRRNAAEYLEALSAAGMDDQVIAEAGRIAPKFPGWSASGHSLGAVLGAAGSSARGSRTSRRPYPAPYPPRRNARASCLPPAGATRRSRSSRT